MAILVEILMVANPKSANALGRGRQVASPMGAPMRQILICFCCRGQTGSSHDFCYHVPRVHGPDPTDCVKLGVEAVQGTLNGGRVFFVHFACFWRPLCTETLLHSYKNLRRQVRARVHAFTRLADMAPQLLAVTQGCNTSFMMN